MVIMIVFLQIKYEFIYISHLYIFCIYIQACLSVLCYVLLSLLRLLFLLQLGGETQYASFIGVVKKRKCTVGLERVNWVSSQVFREIQG